MSESRECPALGGQFPNAMQVYFPNAQLPVYLRPLNAEEAATLDRLREPIVKALNHFRLFRVFTANYKDLIRTIASNLKVGELQDDQKLEFDRALLNLLASGRAITDHFKKYFEARYGGTQNRDEYKNYLMRLRKGSWEFAFVEDVRDFIQHQGLPIVDYSRNYSGTSVTLKLTIDAPNLCKEVDRNNSHRTWKYSKLKTSHGTLDFFDIVREYYMRVSRDLLTFLAKWLAPDFVEAHNFFGRLTAEVKCIYPTATMVILTKFESVGDEHTFSMIFPPEDVFHEMGMTFQP